MKHYKVTYYDGHSKDTCCVSAKSINNAKTKARDVLRSKKAGATILSVEHIKLLFEVSCAAYTKRNPISNPKEIVQIMKNKNIRQLPKRRK